MREKHLSVAFHMHPNWGSSLQRGHAPSLGIEPATLQCTGGCSTTEPDQPGLNPQTFKDGSLRDMESLFVGTIGFQ